MPLHRTSGIFFLLICIFCFTQKINAQCGTPISVFPYTEGFEATNGGWFTGGNLSDWAWGTPAKTVITGAATGTKCWIVGGLAASSYNDSEASWCYKAPVLILPVYNIHIFHSVFFGKPKEGLMAPIFNTQ